MEGEEDRMEKAEDSAEEGPDRSLDEEEGKPYEVPWSQWAGKGGEM